MGLIKAGAGALGGVLADQWKEFFTCDALPADVLVTKGQKRVSGRSSNTKASDNIISAGSRIAVADGQCMIIVEQGKVVEVCAEPGEFIYDASTEPSIFAGSLGEGIKNTFKTVGKRFGFGGDTAKDQRVYYFNTKEIMDNKFGTPTPLLFEVVNKRIGISKTVRVRCNGVYSYVISDPLLFYTKICGNIEEDYTRDNLDAQLKAEFLDALQPAFGALSECELRPAQIPAKANELKNAMNDTLRSEWQEKRGISIERIALNPIALTDEDMQKVQELEDAANLGSNPFMMAGRMTDATADAMKTAAGNAAGAMNGFVGMGMVGNMGAAGNAGFAAARELYESGAKSQNERMQSEQTGNTWTCSCGAKASGRFCAECGSKRPEKETWTCTCGATATGKFCSECGAKKPQEPRVYVCHACGWKQEKPEKAPKFCPECGARLEDQE